MTSDADLRRLVREWQEAQHAWHAEPRSMQMANRVECAEAALLALDVQEPHERERCEAKHPGIGSRCGLPRDHCGDHTILVQTSEQWRRSTP